MRTIDLIAKLQELVDAHEPMKAVMGEHEIMIDSFGQNEDADGFEYLGFNHVIEIEKSSDGVYDILNAWAD